VEIDGGLPLLIAYGGRAAIRVSSSGIENLYQYTPANWALKRINTVCHTGIEVQANLRQPLSTMLFFSDSIGDVPTAICQGQA
jgi:hypothetical protein